MLMSVAGAWAQNNVIRYTATEDLVGVFRSLGEVMSSVYDPNTHEGVVTFTNDITTIPFHSFYLQSSLISIDLPASITSIKLYAFHNCTSLTSVNLPGSLTSIGEGAFYGCTSLASVSIPAQVTYLGGIAFGACNSLKTVTINSQQTLNATGYWTDEDDGIEQRGQGFIIDPFGDQVEEYILNGNITIIPDWKFFRCSITNITLPETLTEIGDDAFAANSLTSITIPASVTSIGTYSFKECPLQSITVNATTPPTLNNSFDDVDNSIPVYVPEGTVDTYKAAGGWKDFTNFTEFCRLNLASSDSSLGKVYGAGMYATYTKATIFAIPEADSKFMGWSDGSTENPRQYVVMEDASLTANFEPVKVFDDPVGAGMRLKVTMKDGKVYEFSTKDVKNVEHFEVTE